MRGPSILSTDHALGIADNGFCYSIDVVIEESSSLSVLVSSMKTMQSTDNDIVSNVKMAPSYTIRTLDHSLPEFVCLLKTWPPSSLFTASASL